MDSDEWRRSRTGTCPEIPAAMTFTPARAPLLYDDSAYAESLRPAQPDSGGPMGLMGRQVAGREFLDAFLTHGEWAQLTALIHNQANAESLIGARKGRNSMSSSARPSRICLAWWGPQHSGKQGS